MKLVIQLKKLEKKKIISRKPHPIIPFILAAISFMLSKIIYEEIFQRLLVYLAIFTIIFAIVHLIVVIMLKK